LLEEQLFMQQALFLEITSSDFKKSFKKPLNWQNGPLGAMPLKIGTILCLWLGKAKKWLG